MSLKIAAAGIAALLWMSAPVTAAMNPIQNPAGQIHNPEDSMDNPAAHINNPASNIYNSSTRMDNPNPLSAPVPQSAVTTVVPAPNPVLQSPPHPQPPPKPVISRKSYYFKTVGTYITAAKKAFSRDDYREFLAVTEDALRRINAGTLKASKSTKHKLIKFKNFGYGLLE